MNSLGAEMTFGGEIEWYSIQDKTSTLDKQMLTTIVMDAVTNNPEQFAGLSELGLGEHAVQSKMNTDKELTREEAIVSLVDRKTSSFISDSVLTKMALIVRIYERAEEEQIELNHDFKEEGGLYRVDTTKTAQQYEISTAIADGCTTAIWLDKLKNIIAEESERLELQADFHDLPSYAVDSNAMILETANTIGSGMHIHYGLRDKNGNNLMIYTGNSEKHDSNGKETFSDMYYACADGVTEVLKQGGYAFSATPEDSFDRHIHGKDTPHIIGLGHKKNYAVRIAESGANLHQELRTPSVTVSGKLAVLTAALGMVDGIAQELNLGRTEKNFIDPERYKKGAEPPSNDIFEDIISDIDANSKASFLQMTESSTKDFSILHSKGSPVENYHTAMEEARRGAIMSAYCPEVLNNLESSTASHPVR